MRGRPKIVWSALAVCWMTAVVCWLNVGLYAVYFARHFTVPLAGLAVAVFVALCFTTVAIGLWRMAPWSRLAGCWLSGLAAVAAAWSLIAFRDPAYAEYGVAAWAGSGVGAVVLLGWLLAPLYFLTRPMAAEAFKMPGLKNEDAGSVEDYSRDRKSLIKLGVLAALGFASLLVLAFQGSVFFMWIAVEYPEPWTKVKLGMTSDEARALLGKPWADGRGLKVLDRWRESSDGVEMHLDVYFDYNTTGNAHVVGTARWKHYLGEDSKLLIEGGAK